MKKPRNTGGKRFRLQFNDADNLSTPEFPFQRDKPIAIVETKLQLARAVATPASLPGKIRFKNNCYHVERRPSEYPVGLITLPTVTAKIYRRGLRRTRTIS